MRFLLMAFALLLTITATSQEPTTFSSDALREDFKVFRGSLEDSHPGLYWYRNRKEMDRIFQETQVQLTQPLSERQFYRTLSAALSKVGCGHTFISHSKSTLEKEFTAFLPMQLRFESGKAYYIKTYGEDNIAMNPGSEITYINGVSMNSIYTACMDMMAGDGYTETGKINMLNDHFWYTYTELFDAPKTYDLEYIDEKGKQQQLSVSAISKEAMYGLFFAGNDSPEARRNIVLSINDTIATLKIKSFFGWKEGKKRVSVEKKLKEVFLTLEAQEVKELIIDLRNNGGGRVPWVLYSYFVDKSFLFAENADFIFSKSSPFNSYQKLHPAMRFVNRKWLHTWLPGSSKMSKLDSSRYEMTGLYLTKPYKPKQPTYNGKVYILTNGVTFSAASDFAAMMKSSGLAIIIGEESGGGYFGNTSMEKSYVTLPHSKIQLEIPLVRHQLNVDEKKNPFGRGVIPDHEVLPSIEDVINGFDRQMEWTLNFIKEQSH